MSQCEERQAIESTIGEYLKDHPGLRQLNALRRQNRTAAAINDEHTSEIFKELVKVDPTLGALFGKGKILKLPVGTIPETIPFEGKKFPTFFRIFHEPKAGLIKMCPKNRTCRVEFETDASNDYFSRSGERGHFNIKGVVVPVSSVHLWNGRASVRFAPPTGANPDDRYSIQVEVSDLSRVDPFCSQFIMEVEPDAMSLPSDGHSTPPGSRLSGIPNIVEIRMDQWVINKFDENTALEIKRAADDQLDFLVNMDNIYLKNEIARRKTTEKSLIEYYFKYGLSLLSLGILHIKQNLSDIIELSDGNEDEGESEWPTEVVRNEIGAACRGAAVTIIPIIIQLGKIPSKTLP